METANHIIAIGASAGGASALSSFFLHNLPIGASYVVFASLPNDCTRTIIQMLSKNSCYKMVEAENNLKIMPNHVYFISNEKHMGIKNNRLYDLKIATQFTPPMSIDSLFSSIAAERREKSMGVLLSGAGRDGSIGVIDIQKSGGLVLVQSPDQAMFEEMPLSALEALHISHTYTAEAMPFVIQDYIELN